jgi:hypothetical protein
LGSLPCFGIKSPDRGIHLAFTSHSKHEAMELGDLPKVTGGQVYAGIKATGNSLVDPLSLDHNAPLKNNGSDHQDEPRILVLSLWNKEMKDIISERVKLSVKGFLNFIECT